LNIIEVLATFLHHQRITPTYNTSKSYNHFTPFPSNTQSIIDMGVSASFNPQLPVKRVLGEGGLGVLGVISASMAIYEEIKK
jgi:hypothetical protein